MKRFLSIPGNKIFLNAFFILLIIIFCFLIGRPFFKRGYFPTQDGEWAIVRLSEMKREAKDLQIPPRWSGFLNHGYGYPLFNFVYPFPYYLGLIPNFLGFTLTDSIKILFAGSIFLSGVGMYFLGKYLRDEWTGFIISIFYLASPYRIANLYIRGSLGEVLSGGLFPFLVLFSLLFLKKGEKKYYLLSSLFLLFVLLSHNVSALFFIPILAVVLVLELFRNKKEKYAITKRTLFIFVSGFGLSSYFIIPAIFEKKNIILSKIPLTNISGQFLTLPSILGTETSKFGPLFQIGIFQILSVCLLAVIILISITRMKKNSGTIYSAGVLFIILLVYIFMMTSVSRPFWNFPLLSSVDFPWRLLGPISFLIVFIFIYLTESNLIKIILTITALVSMIFLIPYVKVNTYFEKNDIYYQSNDATTTSADELMPVWVDYKPTQRYQEKVEIIGGEGKINITDRKSNYWKLTTEAITNMGIRVNTIYYPGWEYKINGVVTKPSSIYINGTVIFTLWSGKNVLEGTFKETPLRLVADFISIFSAFAIFIFVILDRRRRIHTL